MIRMIRQKLAVVLWLVLAAFIATIIFEWGMGGFSGPSDIRSQGYIAKINGEEIKYAELKNIEDSYIKSLDQSESSGVKVAEMRQNAWKDMIRMVVIRQELETQNIVVSPDHVYYEILNNPLPEIRNVPDFMTDGVFDRSKYEEFIKNPRPEFQEFYVAIEQAYAGRIPGMILESRVANSAYISEFELLNRYSEMNLKAKVKFLKAETSKYMPEESEISDSEVEKYFKNNLHEFAKSEEQRNFDFVLFGTEPTQKDSLLALEDINYAMTQLNSGIPFNEVAKNYSEDASAQNGGDLGYFERGAMVQEFEDAAFNAGIDEVVGPVKTQLGYHIIMVTDKKTVGKEIKEVKASHILVKFKTYRETYENAQYAAVNFRDEVYRLGNDVESFSKAAGKLGLKVTEAPFTQMTDRTNELGIVPGLGDFLFNNDVGTVSPIMVSNAGYLLLKVRDIRPERERTLDEVKKTIIFKLRQNKALELAYSTMQEASKSVTDTLTMNEAAEKFDFVTGTTVKFGPDTYLDKVRGVERVMYETAMSMDYGKLSKPFKGSHGAYIIYLIESDKFDQKKYQEEKKAFREREEAFLQRQMIQQWLDGLVERAEVVDYRGLYR